MSQLERDELMERVAAVRALASGGYSGKRQREIELRGFMAIFHPEYTEEQIREMIKEDEG